MLRLQLTLHLAPQNQNQKRADVFHQNLEEATTQACGRDLRATELAKEVRETPSRSSASSIWDPHNCSRRREPGSFLTNNVSHWAHPTTSRAEHPFSVPTQMTHNSCLSPGVGGTHLLNCSFTIFPILVSFTQHERQNFFPGCVEL